MNAKPKEEATLPLLDGLVLHYDTDLKTAKTVQSAFKRVWKRLPVTVKKNLFRCWKDKTSVIIPGLADELIEERHISLDRGPYLAVLTSLPSTHMLSFDCSGRGALLWHGGVIKLMDTRTLDVFIAENIISAFIKRKGELPTPNVLSKVLKKQAEVDYAVLETWGKTFQREIFNLLDQQHPTRIVSPEIVYMMKTGCKFVDLEEEEETEEGGEGDEPIRDNDVTVSYDPQANDSLQNDEVSPEITRLLDQYEEPTDDENFLLPRTEPTKRKSRAKAYVTSKK
jgi:hypothetical protein